MLTIKEVIKTFYNALLQRLKKHRGNWEQNDPTADDYIKNRPFYTDETNKETVVKTKTFTAENSYWQGSPFAFIPAVGETYKVTWDGKEYICTAYLYWNAPTIGNAAITGEGPDTGEPFIYYWYDSYEYGMCVRYQGKHTITIEKIDVTKIDKRYLPDNLAWQEDIDNLYDYANDLDGTISNIPTDTVRYSPQSLSTAQREFARNNISAVGYETQSLSSTFKQRARTNIGAVGYEAQTLTDEQKEQARANIDAVSTSDFESSLESLVIDTSGYFASTVTPKFVRIIYSKSYKNIVFDFDMRFKPSATILNYADNGRLTITGRSAYTIPFGSYIKSYDGMNGFGFSFNGGTAIIFFTEEGQIWIRGLSNAENIVDDFESGRSIRISMPDCIDVETIDPKLIPNIYRVAYDDYIDTLVLCGGNASNSQGRRPLHSSISATALTDGDYYFSQLSTQFNLFLETPDNIIVNNTKYLKTRVAWKAYSSDVSSHTEYAYGNLALIPEELCSYTENSNPYTNFALVKSNITLSGGTGKVNYYLFSKEEGYQLPEVYERTYALKQLDEKFIPSTIARTEYVDTKISDLVNTAPETLDTLNELATALGDDPNFATTVLNQLSNKVEKVEGKDLSTNDYTNEEKIKVSLAAAMYINNVEPEDAAIGSFWYDTNEE